MKQPGDILILFHNFREKMTTKVVFVYVGFCFENDNQSHATVLDTQFLNLQGKILHRHLVAESANVNVIQ